MLKVTGEQTRWTSRGSQRNPTSSKVALQLCSTHTPAEIVTETSTTVVFALPIELHGPHLSQLWQIGIVRSIDQQ